MSDQPLALADAGRPLSGLERVWLTGARLLPPFAVQWVVEGEGELPVERLRTAMQAVAAALPSTRARRRGWLRGTRWVADGPVPAVQRVEVPAWDGRSEAGAAVLEAPLSAVDLQVMHGRLVLRAEHALMDGRGSLLVLEALFAALRGEPPLGETPVLDWDLVAPLGFPVEPAPPRDALPVVPLTGGAGRRWARRTVPGAPAQVVPRAILALAEHTFAQGGAGRVRLDVPVDLRRHRPGLRCTGNLTGFVRVEVQRGDDLQQVRQRLDAALDRDGGAGVVHTADAFRGVPLWLMVMVGRTEARKGARLGLHGTTGTVSSLGRVVDLTALSCPGWRSTAAFVLPPANPDLPLLLTLTGHDHGIELCGTSPGDADPTPAVEAVAEGLLAP